MKSRPQERRDSRSTPSAISAATVRQDAPRIMFASEPTPARRERSTPEDIPLLARFASLLSASFAELAKRLRRKDQKRTLQMLEMQQLGEKRFVAVVRVGRQKFLIGGAASSVSMLAEIGPGKTTMLPPRPVDQERA